MKTLKVIEESFKQVPLLKKTRISWVTKEYSTRRLWGKKLEIELCKKNVIELVTEISNIHGVHKVSERFGQDRNKRTFNFVIQDLSK